LGCRTYVILIGLLVVVSLVARIDSRHIFAAVVAAHSSYDLVRKLAAVVAVGRSVVETASLPYSLY